MQKKFWKDVLDLVHVFVELGGNIFREKSGHLYDLVNKVIMPTEVVECVQNFKSSGQLKYNNYLRRESLKLHVLYVILFQTLPLNHSSMV